MSVTTGATKRRWLWLIPSILLIAGLIVSFAWWQYFKTTPAYSLALLVDAAQQDDRAAFDRVVDLDRVIDSFISQGGPGSALGLTTELVTSMRTQVQSFAPETLAGIKEGVRAEIRNRTNELSGSSSGRPFLLIALAMPFVVEINRTRDSALVRMSNIDQVELTMEKREGGSWKITSLRDQALAARVVSGIVRELPQSESQIDQQMRRQLRALPENLRQLPLLK